MNRKQHTHQRIPHAASPSRQRWIPWQHQKATNLILARDPKHSAYSVPLKGLYKGPYSTPPAAKVSTKNHHKTMKIKVSEAEILRTPIKIEKLSLWNRTWSEFIMNFEFHCFLAGFFFFFFHFFETWIFYFWSLEGYLALLSTLDDYSMFLLVFWMIVQCFLILLIL